MSSDLRVGLGYSTIGDSYGAGVAAASEAVKTSGFPMLTFLFTTDSYDQEAVWEGVKKIVKDSKLVGFCAGGVIVGDSVIRQGVGVLTISGQELRVATSLRGELEKDPFGVGCQVGEDLLASNIRKGTVFIFPDAFVTDVSEALRGLYSTMGAKFKYIGGGAGDNLRFFQTFQFTEAGIESRALAAALIDGMAVRTAVGHGWKPEGEPLIVTKARGKKVFEIDGKPAFEAYSNRLRGIPKGQFAEYGMRHPLGFPDIWANYLIRDPIAVSPDKSIDFVTEVPENAVGYVMSSDPAELIETAGRVAAKALYGIKPQFLLVFDCISRYLLMAETFKEELRAIKWAAGAEVPTLGVLTFGEIGSYGEVPLFHNKTVAVVAAGCDAKAADECWWPDVTVLESAELSILYEISSINFDDPKVALKDLIKEALRRAVRFFGLPYYAVFIGPEGNRQLVTSWGFRTADELRRHMDEHGPRQFRFPLGKKGELGLLFIEKGSPLEERERRLYTVFARQLEKALLRRKEIEERQRIQRLLHEIQAQYKAIVEQPLVGSYILSEDGILYVNKALARMFGYQPEELIGKADPLEGVHPDDRSMVAAQLQRPLMGISDYAHCTFRGLRKDGSIVYCEAFGRRTPLGDKTAIAGVVLNISDRETLKEHLRKSQKTEVLGEMAAAVAHDYANFMTTIMSNIEVAMLKLDENAVVRKYLETAFKTCISATELSRKLLLFGRQGPQSSMKRRPFDLKRVIDEVAALMNNLLGKDIILNTNVSKDLLPVEGDWASIEQMLLNLLLNARDAMPDGGEIFITARNISLQQTKGEQCEELSARNFIHLSVRDTGVGIDPRLLDKIFEPFFSTKDSGTGLGLSIVYSIVKEHRGWIEVSSKPGKGTVFDIYLPALSDPL